MPEWIDYKIKIEHTIRTKLKYKGRITFTPHHLSPCRGRSLHFAIQRICNFTIDGVGEYQTTGLWMGKDDKNNSLKNRLPSLSWPSTPLLQPSSDLKVNEDEYKLMGLAAYGKPKYSDLINLPAGKAGQLIDTRDDGSFRLSLKYFSFRESFQMWNREFEKLLGAPRKPKELITQRHKDLAASIQVVTEEIYFSILNHLPCLPAGRSLHPSKHKERLHQWWCSTERSRKRQNLFKNAI